MNTWELTIAAVAALFIRWHNHSIGRGLTSIDNAARDGIRFVIEMKRAAIDIQALQEKEKEKDQ